jgi:hypothetical protein
MRCKRLTAAAVGALLLALAAAAPAQAGCLVNGIGMNGQGLNGLALGALEVRSVTLPAKAE